MHNIQNNDNIVATKKTWHGLKTLVDAITYENSGLNWIVEENALVNCYGPIEGWNSINRADNGLLIAVAKDSYKTIQNERIFEMIDNSLVGVDYEIDCTGSLGDCKKVFVSINLKGAQKWVVNGDDFQSNLIFASSHDGSQNLEAFDSHTRVVCQNTLNFARSSKGKMNLRVRHTKNADMFIGNMEQQIETLFAKRKEFFASMDYLANKPLSMGQADKILTGFIVDQPNKELSTRTKNQKQDMLLKFVGGIGNNGHTRYDLLNGVTEYFTRLSNKSDLMKNFTSSMIGNGSAKKLEMYESLISDERLNQLAEKGEQCLKYNNMPLYA